MNVIVAEEAGFCFGVKRALGIIDELSEQKQEIHIYGPLVHNKTVLEDLESRGIGCIDSLDQYESNRQLIVRTHGIPRYVEDELERKDIGYTDATCPFVKKLHKIAAHVSAQSDHPLFLIVGDKTHAEIIAAHSYSPNARIIANEAEARLIPPQAAIAVMVQTTYDAETFTRITAILQEKTPRLKVFNTICNASILRQEAVRKLAPTVDMMIVIGGKNSSNTKKLVDIARRLNTATFQVESYQELSTGMEAGILEKAVSCRSIGLTAGASTPPEEIENVKTFFRNLNINTVKEINHGRSKRNSEH